MLPTKGYFQDIECPYYSTTCGRPYCHFRHRKKPSKQAEDSGTESEKDTIPTYKPTPKSELADIQSNRNHIPISYVPDLAFRHEKKHSTRLVIENPTYNPTPLSLLSSVNNSKKVGLNDNFDVINEIKQNIANVQYDPTTVSKQNDINFEELSTEFELIDEIINNKKSCENESEIVPNIKTEDINKEVKDISNKDNSSSSSSSKRKHKHKKTHDDNKKSKHSNKDKHSSSSSTKNSSSSSSSKHKSSKSSSKDKNSSNEKDKDKKSSSNKKRKHSHERDDDNHKRDNDNHKHKRNSKDKHKKDDDKHKHHNKHKSNKTENESTKINKNENESTKINKNEDIIDSDIELNEDETMLECYRIFNEYNPTENNDNDNNKTQKTEETTTTELTTNKKRIAHTNNEQSINNKYVYNKPKVVQTPGEILTNRYKLAKLSQANKEQELLINEINNIKKPVPTLLEAAKERKKIREAQLKQSTNLIDDIIQGSTKKIVPKIAPVSNVLAMTKAKERISKLKPTIPVINKTAAQTQKGTRIAHVPEISLSDIPDVLQVDKSRLPVNVRTRFLTMIADECVKLYISKEEAYNRALKEEFNCYEKCKVLTTYRNSAMLAVNRLRKEIQERNKNGLGLINIGEDDGGGCSGESKARLFYTQVKSWVLNEEELDIHGYPRQSDENGVAIVKNFKSSLPTNLDSNARICSRCNKMYQVDDDGWALYDDECYYHPLKKRTIRGEQIHLCCKSSADLGCCSSDTHVSDGFISARLEGYQTTMESEIEDDPRSSAVYALDCEMCYTTKGLELTRVTIIDIDCKVVYESLVKPLHPIIDYNTKFSGITKEQMDRTSTSILQVQANILHLCNSQTILVGHSLESDMKALKIVHSNIIDTAVLFPHKMGLPHKRALRTLASEYLRKIIQNDVNGHDSAEDAVTCMELLKWKLKEDSKKKPSK